MLPVVPVVQERSREVGCQSDSVERRDAAVQVDVPTQRLGWRHCPADEPGGGALLRPCRTHTLDTGLPVCQCPPVYLLCCPLMHTQLPTRPLFGPPGPSQQQESEEPSQTAPLPSTPLCGPLPPLLPADVLAPPPPAGLIAPLSPRLAEEDDKDGVKVEEMQKAGRPRRKTAGPPVRYLLESEGQSHDRLSNHSKARGLKENLRKEHEEEPRMKQVKVEETQQVRRTWRKTAGPPVRYLSEEQSHDLLTASHSKARGLKEKIKLEGLRKEDMEEEEEDEEIEEEEHEEEEEMEEKEEDGVTTANMEEMQQAGRPRRKTVGPPIRYLLESEGQSHGLLTANHSKARGLKENLRQEDQEDEKEHRLNQVTMEMEEVGRPRRKTVGPPIRYLLESEGQSHDLLSNHSKARGLKEKIKLEGLRKEDMEEEEEDEVDMGEEDEEIEEEEGEEEEMEEEDEEIEEEEHEEEGEEEEMEEEEEDGVTTATMEEMQQAGRPRRKTVGPPIRYLLESEGQSHDLLTANHSKARGAMNMKMWRLQREEKEDSDKVPAVKKRRESQWSAMTTNHNAGGVQSNDRRRRSIAHLKKKMEDDEKSHQDISQSEARSETRQGETRTRCRERSIGSAPSQHTRAEGGEDMVVRNKKEQEGGQKTRRAEEQAGRPRRRMVGPPVRYLLESESWSHGQSMSNPCTARGVRDQGSEAEEEKEEVELKEQTDSSRVDSSEDEGAGGGSQLCQVCGLSFTCRSSLQLHLSAHRAGSRLHHRRAADDKQDEEVDTNRGRRQKLLLPAPTKPFGWLKSTRRMHRNPWWWVNYRTIMWRRQDGKRWRSQREVDGGKGKKGGRRGEEEEEGGGKEKGRQKEVVVQPQRLRRNMVGPPIRYLVESEEASHGPVTANQDRSGVFKPRKKAQQRSNAGGGVSADTAVIDRSVAAERQTGHMVTERKKTLLPASTEASDWWRCQNPRWWFDHRTVRRRRQECDGDRWKKTRWSGEEEEGEGKERWMEEQPQRPRRKMVGPPIRYLLESEEQSHVPVSQSDQNQARAFKQDVKTQKKNKAGGGASERTAMTDRSDDGEMITERQTGHMVSHRRTHQSRQVTVTSPCCVRLRRLSLIGRSLPQVLQ